MDDISIRRRVARGSLVIGLVITCGAFAETGEQDSNDDDRLLTTVTVTAQKRNRVFSYVHYLDILNRGTELP